MHGIEKQPLVKTIKEKCRVCYTCVRECPAKAIRISGGQAEVIQDRCIGCGNCFRVCSQQAKQVRCSKEYVFSLLASDRKTAACLAPSFAAEFYDMDYRNLVGLLRTLGFDYVIEVAFGADLVSLQYKELVENSSAPYIATTCPAIVSYIEKYHPALVPNLAPVASPMISAARALHRLYGDEIQIVFIGPCLAKKDEALREDLSSEVAEVLTFIELRSMLERRGLSGATAEPSEFDPPHPGKGTLYPIGRGMLQSAEIQEDLLSNTVFATDGTKQFVHTLKEYESIPHNIRLLELLCCNGCIMGPGMTTKQTHFSRRSYVSQYAQERYHLLDRGEWDRTVEKLKDLDLSVRFRENDLRIPAPTKEELQVILRNKGKFNPEDELNCGACGYDTCMEHAIAIHMGLAESEMCLPYTIDTLKNTARELKESYEELVDAKNALIQSEKLASLGRLASGIAHEINNPLTGVLTYSSLLLEDLKDSEYTEDLETIVKETLRCRNIVKGLLDFARESKHEKEPANLNDIILNTLKILEKHINFQAIRIEKQLDDRVPNSMMDVNQMKSVINNLSENAAHAMPGGGVISISTRYDEGAGMIIMEVSDTGVGIREENLTKIFDPFFTTKTEGRGTGLGLAVIFGIIRRHNGTIQVRSTVGVGTAFTIQLPAREPAVP